MLSCKVHIVIQVPLKNIDWNGISHVSGGRVNGSNGINDFDEIVITKTRSETKKGFLQLLKARAGESNAIVTRQRTDVLIDRIGDQFLTFFGRNVDEIAVAIQLGSHFKNNHMGAMSRKRAK